MIRTIPLKIQNEYITGDKGMIGAAGSHNDVILRMEFSGMWDGLTKMVQFRDALGEATIEVLLTADMLEADDTSVYLVPVPSGAKKYAGEMTLCIKGAAVSAQKETRATLAVYGRFAVAESKWSADAETEADVPATNAEQLQKQIENVLATIVDARKAATEAAKSAEGAAWSQSRAQTSEKYAGEYAQNAADSAIAAGNSAASASSSATAAAESIKHAPRINASGKWELWDATKNAYVATEYTAIGEDGTKWWTYAYPIGITDALEVFMGKANLPDAAIGDYVLHTMSDAGIVFEITGETASGSSWVVKEKCTLRGKDGTTPRIGANGNWYIGSTDTGKPSRGAAGEKGDPGAKGDPGEPGTTGPQGPKGTDGITPSIGANGNWFLGTTDTNKPSRGATGAKGDPGEPGAKGDPGEPGAAGKDGTTPHIGANGNWYIGDTDTGVKAASVYYVDISGTNDDITGSKTFAEIKAAYEANNVVVARQNIAIYELTYISDTRAEFTRVGATGYTVWECSNSGAPSEADIWQFSNTKRVNYDTKYRDIGLKTVPGAIKELQDKSSPAVTDADAGKYLHVNPSTKELEWAEAGGGGSDLPTVTAADAGKFLRVSSSGSWVAETLANANGGEF